MQPDNCDRGELRDDIDKRVSIVEYRIYLFTFYLKT